MAVTYRFALVIVAVSLIGCLPVRISRAPQVVATGAWIGWGETQDDSGFAIRGTLNGRPLEFVVDYGANAFLLSDRMYDSLRLPHPYANASRVQVVIREPGVALRLDSTANAIVQHNDTITEYWGDFEPLLADSLRVGRSLQQHILLGGELSYASLHLDAGIGRDMLSQFDVEFDGPAHTIRLYDWPRTNSLDSSVHSPRWLPSGLVAADCLPAVVIGPQPVPALGPADTAGLSDAEKRKIQDVLLAARRMLTQRELKFPVVLEGHAFTATFDSGTRDAIVNTAAAQLLGFTSANPRVQMDPGDSTLFASDVDMRVGARPLASPRVWVADTKFQGEAAYETTPMMLLGLTQFRNRVLFLSHSTGTICIGPPR